MLKLPGSTLGLTNQNRALPILAYTVLAVAVLGGLYWAQTVVIPLALGILFTTISAPVVRLIERCGVGRIIAVIIYTLAVGTVAAALTWLIFAQTTQLYVDIPTYEENIVAKVSLVKSLTHSKSQEGWNQLSQKIEQSLADAGPAPPSPPSPGKAAKLPSGESVVMTTGTVALALLAQVFGHVALAAVVAIFLLIDREDARNRIIQLIGRGQITQTTKAFDDASRRISRFLLMQALINVAYGVCLTIGLLILGVHYAILWGVLSVVLRYIPYVGGTLAALLPITLALAQFSSWWPALVIVALVLAMELIINNFVEPKLYGQSIGVSSVALIMAAAFWTFLWGPVGLLIAGPLTVCLVVLGKYVPPLRFLSVLLGDQSPLDREMVLYQRLLARDELETDRILEQAIETKPLQEVYDSLVFPAAVHAGVDRDLHLLTVDDERQLLETLEEAMLASAEHDPTLEIGHGVRRVRLLVVAARDYGDRLGMQALTNTLHPKKYELIPAAAGRMGAEIVAQAAEEQVDGICISSLPPGGLSHTKYLCKRIRARLPQAKIFVGHWCNDDLESRGWDNLEADVVVHSLKEMLRQLEAWRPVLEANHAPTTPPAPHFATTAVAVGEAFSTTSLPTSSELNKKLPSSLAVR